MSSHQKWSVLKLQYKDIDANSSLKKNQNTGQLSEK